MDDILAKLAFSRCMSLDFEWKIVPLNIGIFSTQIFKIKDCLRLIKSLDVRPGVASFVSTRGRSMDSGGRGLWNVNEEFIADHLKQCYSVI